MKYLELPGVPRPASNIILGLMRISDKTDEEIRTLYGAAREAGINFIDHANVYGGNHLCERRWAKAVQPSSAEREEIIIQTKAGIVPGDITYFDFSYETLVTEAEKSSQALGTNYLDIFCYTALMLWSSLKKSPRLSTTSNPRASTRIRRIKPDTASDGTTA